jgi:hypothetical protein
MRKERDGVDREKVIKGLESLHERLLDAATREKIAMLDAMIVADALALLKAQEPITGETSDGYHTFNELYHHRAVLFSVIVANYKDRAWKSVRHHDGTMYDGMFIVGIDTPDGQATYHYDIDPYWDMFDCKVREFAPEWDGHTPAQAIERIGKLKAQEAVKPNGKQYQCNKCKFYQGVHNVMGHAPCSFLHIGGVMWNDYCSRFSQFTDK